MLEFLVFLSGLYLVCRAGVPLLHVLRWVLILSILIPCFLIFSLLYGGYRIVRWCGAKADLWPARDPDKLTPFYYLFHPDRLPEPERDEEERRSDFLKEWRQFSLEVRRTAPHRLRDRAYLHEQWGKYRARHGLPFEDRLYPEPEWEHLTYAEMLVKMTAPMIELPELEPAEPCEQGGKILRADFGGRG